jgi:hypothetical protein
MFENFSRKGYIIIIVIIAGIIVLSQQTFFSGYGRSLYYSSVSNSGQYWQKAKDWVFSGFSKNSSGEEAKGGETTTAQNKTNLFENILKK